MTDDRIQMSENRWQKTEVIEFGIQNVEVGKKELIEFGSEKAEIGIN